MIRAVFFIIVVVVTTSIGAIIVMILGLFNRYSRFTYFQIVQRWARLVVWTSGTTVTVRGLEHIDSHKPYIVVSNHQSHMDIPVLIGYLPLHMTIIAKKELFRIPIFAQGMYAVGILKIDRSNRTRAFETLKKAEEVLKKYNISVLAFPEGTRSRNGMLQPFKKGPFVMAINSGIDILPITISGTFPILPKGRLLVRPGSVTLTVHPPIQVSPYSLEDRDRLIEIVHETIAKGLFEYA
ncbi:MAG: 1-acyl-sn-glycerol-3-phosphate acyltransferase [Calditrichaeota bacterium]|nr:MAG: 1-acyl-sn-glycerol-3-phosphate acyltransferase [Calditrichota bacterium]